MDMITSSLPLINNNFFSLVLLPILIFLARVIDVSMGTFVVRGMKFFSALIGFFEILIWLSAITQIMANLSNPINYLAYAGGFATGNYFGIFLESKIAIGYQLIRVITSEKAEDIIKNLQTRNIKLTKTKAITNGGSVDILYIPVKRKKIKNILKTIKNHDPDATYTIQDIKTLSEEKLTNKPITEKNKIQNSITKKK